MSSAPTPKKDTPLRSLALHLRIQGPYKIELLLLYYVESLPNYSVQVVSQDFF